MISFLSDLYDLGGEIEIREIRRAALAISLDVAFMPRAALAISTEIVLIARAEMDV